MKIELDELELATVKAALDYFGESLDADDEGRLPRFKPFQCVDENIGALTSNEMNALVRRIERESDALAA